jgi:hypothetical protein
LLPKTDGWDVMTETRRLTVETLDRQRKSSSLGDRNRNEKIGK